jgi:Rod binding domain-containing protein
MTALLSGVLQVQPSQVADAKHAPPAASDLHRVAKEFEAIMVHELLQAANVAGGGQGSYKGMAVDAFANGISQAGGLGLARQLEDALARNR